MATNKHNGGYDGKQGLGGVGVEDDIPDITVAEAERAALAITAGSKPDEEGEVLRKRVVRYLNAARTEAKRLIMEKSELDCESELMAAFHVRAALNAAVEVMDSFYARDEDMA